MAANLITNAPPAAEEEAKRGEEALERLRSADPPLYLSPSPELSQDARAACRYLFSSLVPFCPKPPLDSLLAGEGFDAEQIWYQIDLLSRPLLSVLRRELNRLERDPPARVLGSAVDGSAAGEAAAAEKERVVEDGEGDEEDGDESEGDEDEEGEEEEEEENERDEEEEEDGEEEEEEGEVGEAKGNRVEDEFLKIKELEEYLKKEEEEEYGLPERKGKKHKAEELDELEEDEDGEEDEDDDEEEDEEDDLDVRIFFPCFQAFLPSISTFCLLLLGLRFAYDPGKHFRKDASFLALAILQELHIFPKQIGSHVKGLTR